MPPKQKAKIVKDVTQLVLARRTRMCNFLEYKGEFSLLYVGKWGVDLDDADTKVVYRRYASLFFVCGIASGDNELITLEIIHRYVEVLDRYFGNVRFCLRCFGMMYSLNGYYLGVRAGPVRFESVAVRETFCSLT